MLIITPVAISTIIMTMMVVVVVVVILTHINKTKYIKPTQEIILVAPPILSRVYNQLGNGIVNLNNARKITSFPIPFPLAQMITLTSLFAISGFSGGASERFLDVFDVIFR